ncbi:MAG: hypothetical protein Q9187_004236 [Circinaria calcarea]
MFSYLPPLTLHDAHSLWYPTLSGHSVPSSTAATGTHHHANPQQNRNSHPTVPVRTVLSILRSEEKALLQRKKNIERFGAAWLKPPGVTKTYQGILDEQAEREEQEAVAQREMAMLEAQAAAEEAEDGADVMDDGDDGAEERDLDDEIPDADQEENVDVDDGQAWEDEDGDDALPNEEGDGDYAGEEGETQVRDLDDDVPEGGSYQHTDTDIEDESSEDGADIARESLPAGVSRSGGLPSSVFGSSPNVQPRAAARRSGNLPRRGQGREN